MSIAKNIQTIRQNIKTTATAHGHDPNTVNLVAVSKRQPSEKIQKALNAGHRLFGENRVQEAMEHWQTHRTNYNDLTLHLIGPLQTNKTKEAVTLFDVIETIDREKLARTLAKEMEKQNRYLPGFIQVNTGEEEQKSGIAPVDLPAFYEFCTKECNLNITGLMCIPPINEPAAMHFGLLNKLAKQLNLPNLSMGMSADYEKAVTLGATHIRIGTDIFGKRN